MYVPKSLCHARFVQHLCQTLDSSTIRLQRITTSIRRPNQSNVLCNKNSEEHETTCDKKLGLHYTTLRPKDVHFSRMLLAVGTKKQRPTSQHKHLIEGRRLIMDAIAANWQIETIFFSQIEQLAPLASYVESFSTAALYKVTQSDMRNWSQLVTAPGIMAIVLQPNDEVIEASLTNRLPLTVVCENVRDPSNVGHIIRTCAAVGCDQVLLMKGCANAWEGKSMRSGAGGHFRVKVRGPLVRSELATYLPPDTRFFAAECNPQVANTVNYAEGYFRDSAHITLIVRGETSGISCETSDLMKQSGQSLHIPLMAGVDSLNTGAALAVILFEIKRQLIGAG